MDALLCFLPSILFTLQFRNAKYSGRILWRLGSIRLTISLQLTPESGRSDYQHQQQMSCYAAASSGNADLYTLIAFDYPST